jgi:hypothetical protein
VHGPLVLPDDAPCPPEQVALGQPAAIGSEDMTVDLRFGKARIDEHQP